MPLIPLSNRPGMFTFVSDIDLPLVAPYPWRLNANGYLITNMRVEDRKSHMTYLHRCLMTPLCNQQVD